MSNKADGLDASFTFPSADDLRAWKAAGGQVVSSYLAPGHSGKAWTPDRLRLVHSLGLGAELNFEWYSGRAREGYDAGVTDGQTAAAQYRALVAAVGYAPKSRIIIPLSADFDASASDLPKIDAYLRGAQHGLAGAADAGVYGEYDVVVHTAATGVSHMEWQTYAWSNGKFAAGVTDFYQWRIDQSMGAAAVDYDQVIDAAKLGAWWPPGSVRDHGPTPIPIPTPTPTPTPGDVLEAIMAFYKDTATFEAAMRAIIHEEVLTAIHGGVNVNGLLDYAHDGTGSIEAYFTGLPGYKTLESRRPKPTQ